jgi:hypothetical protein
MGGFYDPMSEFSRLMGEFYDPMGEFSSSMGESKIATEKGVRHPPENWMVPDTFLMV